MATDLDKNLTLTSDGDLTLLTGDDALAARLESRANTQQGEWPFNLGYGVPWMFSILGERADTASTRALIAASLLADPEAVAVDRIEFSFSASTRTATISASVKSVSGQTVTVQP